MADPSTLRNNARCFDCEIPEGMFLSVMAYVLQQTIDGELVSADPSTLANDARCYDCVGVTPGMIIKQLVALNAGGGGAGGVGMQVYEGRAPAAPDDPTKAAIDYPVGGGVIQQWDIGTATWV